MNNLEAKYYGDMPGCEQRATMFWNTLSMVLWDRLDEISSYLATSGWMDVVHEVQAYGSSLFGVGYCSSLCAQTARSDQYVDLRVNPEVMKRNGSTSSEHFFFSHRQTNPITYLPLESSCSGRLHIPSCGNNNLFLYGSFSTRVELAVHTRATRNEVYYC